VRRVRVRLPVVVFDALVPLQFSRDLILGYMLGWLIGCCWGVLSGRGWGGCFPGGRFLARRFRALEGGLVRCWF